MSKTIICVGDLHFPFVCKKTLRWVFKMIRLYKPDYVVQMGDLYDLFSFGRWARGASSIGMTPHQEIMKARKMAEDFWIEIKDAAPSAKLKQLKGNHDERPSKQLIEKAPEYDFLLKHIDELFSFGGVWTQKSERDELIMGNILFQHGFRSKLGDHCKHNKMNTVCGHTHKGGVHFERLGKEVIWELNAGYLGDPESLPLSYTKQRKISKWTKGLGIIDKDGPRFIPCAYQ